MAKNTTWSIAARNAAMNVKTALLNNGYLRLYDGTQRASPDTALGAQVLLAELRLSATAFPAAVNGVATANAITSDSSANATGTATWFTLVQSDGTTAVMDGSFGTSGANAIAATASIVLGAVVDCSALTITDAAASAL